MYVLRMYVRTAHLTNSKGELDLVAVHLILSAFAAFGHSARHVLRSAAYQSIDLRFHL